MNTIEHRPQESRFVTIVEGIEAELNYNELGGVLHITHTGVPSEIGGRGIAGQLVKAAFEHARSADLKVSPDCTYAEAWVGKHPDYNDLVI